MLRAYGGDYELPKAGKYEFPYFDLDHVIDKLKEYYDVVRTDETTREVVAETLNMSKTGGGFLYLVSSMEKYGLVQTGGGNVTITKLGKTILYGEPSEIKKAKAEAVTKVDLFKELRDQYGKDAQLEQIRAFLRQKANVDVVKAQKIAPKVDKIYKKVSNYIIPAQKLVPPSKEPMLTVPSEGRRDMIVQPEPSVVELLKIQFGDVYIQIPSDAKSLDSIKLAKDALDFMEQRLLKKQKEKKTD